MCAWLQAEAFDHVTDLYIYMIDAEASYLVGKIQRLDLDPQGRELGSFLLEELVQYQNAMAQRFEKIAVSWNFNL